MGLPATADDDSWAANDIRGDPAQEPAVPVERNGEPAALEEFGVNPEDERRGEPLEGRIAREVPEEAREGAGEPVSADEVFGEEAPVAPHLGSSVSLYDRPVAGIPERKWVGRLVQPDEGAHQDVEPTEIAADVGPTGGGLSPEEAAMHLVPSEPSEDIEREEAPPKAMNRKERKREERERQEREREEAKRAMAEADTQTEAPRAGEARRPPTLRTGAEQPWEPVDLVIAKGLDPTPENVERARRELEELGPAAIEKVVP